MKPKPFASLNHFTVPRATGLLLTLGIRVVSRLPLLAASARGGSVSGHRDRSFVRRTGANEKPASCPLADLSARHTSTVDRRHLEYRRGNDLTQAETSNARRSVRLR